MLRPMSYFVFLEKKKNQLSVIILTLKVFSSVSVDTKTIVNIFCFLLEVCMWLNEYSAQAQICS